MEAKATVAVMASNLECVGLGIADEAALEALLAQVLPSAVEIGRDGAAEILRWEDPSGARLVVAREGGEVTDLLPSFRGRPGTLLSNIIVANEDVMTADVVDNEANQLTALAIELEERRILGSTAVDGTRPAVVVGLGVQVSTFADADAFGASKESLLVPEREGSEPPEGFAARGLSWPPRMAPESFMSHGVFGAPANAKAYARLAGTVISAESRTVAATGQSFVHARVRSVFDLDVCTPFDGTPPPAAGSVIAGTVFLVGSVAVAGGRGL